MISNPEAKEFRKGLYVWHQDINRDMPWKATKDAYKIWISEIILQQTRVAQAKSIMSVLSRGFLMSRLWPKPQKMMF